MSKPIYGNEEDYDVHGRDPSVSDSDKLDKSSLEGKGVVVNEKLV